MEVRDDLAEDAVDLGWDVTHLHALNIPTEEVEKACVNADMFLWSRTHGYNPVGDSSAMLRRIEDSGTVTVAQHMDLYWGIPTREPHIGTGDFWSCQYVFTADGGHQKEFAERAVNHFWCPPAVGSRWVGRGAVNKAKYPAKVVFVGRFYRTAHGQHRLELIQWAKGRYGGYFRQYGGDKNGWVWGTELSDLCASAHVIIGDSAPANYYWSDRIVNTLGRGGLLAHTETMGLTEQGFTKDTMIRYKRGAFSTLGREIDTLTPKRRKEMTDAALTVIEERHTWKKRLLEIQKVVFG